MHDQLTAYIDFKSPYAYLAIEPTRLLAKELNLKINWLPFVLDIPSYLGSAKLDASGVVAEQSRSADQWSKVKYAYYDCRRYATLRGMTIRGTVKIWDTHLAATGMLWAKQQGDDVLDRYIDSIYMPFWKRKLEADKFDVIQNVLADAGAEVSGFSAFSKDAGAVQNHDIQTRAFAQGIFGVPSYVQGDEIFFGREHLPRIRWNLQGATGTAPDIAYELMPDDIVEKVTGHTLDAWINKEDPESCIAIRQIISLAKELDLTVNWHQLEKAKPHREPDKTDESRGARHHRYRVENRARDQHRYMRQILEGGNTGGSIDRLLKENDICVQDGEVPAAWAGMTSQSGYVGSPVFRIGEETFVGRQHLPLIRARFE